MLRSHQRVACLAVGLYVVVFVLLSYTRLIEQLTLQLPIVE